MTARLRVAGILCGALVVLAVGWLVRASWQGGEDRTGQEAVAPVPRNLLLITADTTRQDVLGPYGGAAPTPALDALADAGVVFEQAFTVATGTTPSHASLFSSHHPREHGVYDNATVLGDEHLVLAEALQAAGLRTAAFVGARPVAARLGFGQGFEEYDDTFSWDDSLGPFSAHERRARRTVERFGRWLEQHAHEPFFAWVHLFDPHQPYSPESPLGETSPLDALFVDEQGFPAYLRAEQLLAGPAGRLAQVDVAARARYHQEVGAVDRAVQTLVGALEVHGLSGTTLVVFVSDHGENFLADGTGSLFNHGGLRGSVTRLALLLKLPGSERAGIRSRRLVGNLDVAPTILELMGLPVPPSWSGASFADAVRGEEAAAGRRHLVIESAEHALVSVRTGRWAFVAPRHAGVGAACDETTLYDLRADPGEAENLCASRPAELAAMRALVERFEAGAGGAAGEPLSDPEHRAALRALGYAGDGP